MKRLRKQVCKSLESRSFKSSIRDLSTRKEGTFVELRGKRGKNKPEEKAYYEKIKKAHNGFGNHPPFVPFRFTV